MTRYLVTYDLNQPQQEYEDLYDAIKSYSSYVHAMDSVWFIDTTDNASDPYSAPLICKSINFPSVDYLELYVKLKIII